MLETEHDVTGLKWLIDKKWQTVNTDHILVRVEKKKRESTGEGGILNRVSRRGFELLSSLPVI